MGDEQNRGTGSGTTLRLLGSFAALAAGAAAVVIAVLLVRDLPAVASSSSSSLSGSIAPVAETPAPAAPAGFPTPPRGAVVFGAEAGRNALGLAVSPGKGKIGLQASIIPREDKDLNGRTVRFEALGASGKKVAASGVPCGRGCFRTTVPIARPTSVVVHLSGEKPVTYAMPAAWPPPPADEIIRQADATWRGLKTIAYRDLLGDGHVTLKTNWKAVSPNRLEFRIEDGQAGIIIGPRRWDKLGPGKPWVGSPQYPVTQPIPFWQSVTNAYVLGTVMHSGRPAWKVSFFDPIGGPGWVTLVVDKQTMHTMELWMTAHVHFMHDSYGFFDAPLKITPPKN